ncbi:dipeptidase [Compostibacillus humi]|uniref:Dipeptidase n=1 Tax=Compostibacillus humi TaxID=1245525 RepID=A0A8J3EK92_9BACI|nr:dipeptidase [Compostibacillus humi]GGH71265.1 dipeptidase [Compostibacillus humi]
MNIIDTHCDALFKLQWNVRSQYDKKPSLDYQNAEELDTNVRRLQQGDVKVQFYAIFIPPEVPENEKWQHALEQVDLFYREVIGKNPNIVHIRSWKDLETLQEEEIGAVITLEGADPIGNDIVKLRHLFRLGVLSFGLTWNHANLCADGAEEPRGAGLTVWGKEVVKENNRHQVLTDVSHLSVRGFWDVIELADYPFASHSNARTVCDHPRNLYDDQIRALIEKNGTIHVVFYPPFINEGKETAEIADLLRHIDHICSLGGEKHIGFGSDFDGISSRVRRLEHAGQYENLINELLKYYPEETVKGFCYQNFMDCRPHIR